MEQNIVYYVIDTHTSKRMKHFHSERGAYAYRDKLEAKRATYGAIDGKRYEVVCAEFSSPTE